MRLLLPLCVKKKKKRKADLTAFGRNWSKRFSEKGALLQERERKKSQAKFIMWLEDITFFFCG